MPDQGKPDTTADLGSFLEDCHRLDEPAFRARHGDLFFLHHGPLSKLRKASSASATRDSEGTPTLPAKPINPMADSVVFRVPLQLQVSDDLIWIGRSDQNDLVLPDSTVSAIHAFLRRDPDGRVIMHDSNSRNGTMVEGKPVASPGEGPPATLESGHLVLLGNVKLTFLHAAELMSLVKQLLR